MPSPHPRALALFERLSQAHRTPAQVQTLLRSLPYNRERNGETLRSAWGAWKRGRAHCLEAAFLAAAILERRGHPPLVMSLESQDNLDHVIFVFKTPTGWGSVARSRDEGLHGRPPLFRTPRALAASYWDPYVDRAARVTGFGIASLDDTRSKWRDSGGDVWKAEQYLIDLRHERLPMPEARYRRMLAHYLEHGAPKRQPWWW